MGFGRIGWNGLQKSGDVDSFSAHLASSTPAHKPPVRPVYNLYDRAGWPAIEGLFLPVTPRCIAFMSAFGP